MQMIKWAEKCRTSYTVQLFLHFMDKGGKVGELQGIVMPGLWCSLRSCKVEEEMLNVFIQTLLTLKCWMCLWAHCWPWHAECVCGNIADLDMLNVFVGTCWPWHAECVCRNIADLEAQLEQERNRREKMEAKLDQYKLDVAYLTAQLEQLSGTVCTHYTRYTMRHILCCIVGNTLCCVLCHVLRCG